MEQRQTTFSFFITTKFKWTTAISLSVFLYLFMAVFLPFGVSNYNPNHQYTLNFLGTLGFFALVTFCVAWGNEFIIKPIAIKTISLLRIVLWSIWLIIVLGVSNYMLYNYLGEWHDFNFTSGIDFSLNIGSVFIFPMVGIFFYFRYSSLKLQYEQVLTNRDTMVNDKALLLFKGQGNNEQISIVLEDFLYAKAQDNYIELYYVANHTIQKDLLRTTMSSVLDDVNSKWLARCHRSYMINLFNVRSLKSGTSTKLYLNHISQPVPVSASFKDGLLEILKEVKSFN